MQAYGIDYTVKGREFSANVDAKDAKSAKNKLARKHKVKPAEVKIKKTIVIGYY